MGTIRLRKIEGDVSIRTSNIQQFRPVDNVEILGNTNYIVRVGRKSQAILTCQNDVERPISNETFTVSKYCRPLRVPITPSPLRLPDEIALANSRKAEDTDMLSTEKSFARSAPTIADLALSSDDSERLTHQINQVKAQPLDPVQEAIEIAKIYLKYGYRESGERSETFYRLASETLKVGIDTSLEDSQIRLLKADVYLMLDLPSSAREQYRQAFEIADRNGMLDDKAQSYIGLALVAENISEDGEAVQYFEKARVIYESLNKLEVVSILTALISNI